METPLLIAELERLAAIQERFPAGPGASHSADVLKEAAARLKQSNHINEIADRCERELPPGYEISLTLTKFENESFQFLAELTDADLEDVYVDAGGDFIGSAIAAAQEAFLRKTKRNND